ncbi:MAG: DUF2191 domain-containing protein [Acidobacteria bacterium]|nr:DUF2191 domain-containing protein [Acidobacteriota bacterium]MCG3193215.1 hypothetical protein [Thermoanaerobaculia bacterium]
MKTTIEITDSILEEAKETALKEGTTLRALVEDGLRRVLDEKRKKEPFKLRQVTVKGEGLNPGFQGAGWDRWLAAIYEGRGG